MGFLPRLKHQDCHWDRDGTAWPIQRPERAFLSSLSAVVRRLLVLCLVGSVECSHRRHPRIKFLRDGQTDDVKITGMGIHPSESIAVVSSTTALYIV
jgi:hypothetical protein